MIFENKTIYFFRHGEGMDDIKGEFGGWSDPELSPKGKELAKMRAEYFKTRKYNFEIILTSPLKRASQSAAIIGEFLDIPVEAYVYLKERNTYGILGGVKKKEAKKRYPSLLKAYNAQEFIPGAERYEDFKSRVELLLSKLPKLKYSSILCVTHGYLITTIMEEFLSLERKIIKDGCILGLNIKNDKFDLIETKDLTYSEGERTYDSVRYRKFK